MSPQEKLESALEARVAQTASVVANREANTISNLIFRKRPCQAVPVAALADPTRIECGGIQYQIIIRAEAAGTRHYTARLNIRVVPHRGSADPYLSKTGNGAYIAFYAADETSERDCFGYLDVTDRNLFPELTASEWYAVWVREALRHSGHHKLLQYKRLSTE